MYDDIFKLTVIYNMYDDIDRMFLVIINNKLEKKHKLINNLLFSICLVLKIGQR